MTVLSEPIEAGKVIRVIGALYPLSESPKRPGISRRDTLEGKVVIIGAVVE